MFSQEQRLIRAHGGMWEDVSAGDTIGWLVFSFCCGMLWGENEGRPGTGEYLEVSLIWVHISHLLSC